MSTAEPVSAKEAKRLFADLASLPALVLAVSGGPDSTALLYLAARWRAGLKKGPKLLAVTIDHGLRAESAREAKEVARLARKLGVQHRTISWRGRKPARGLQEAAREARYRLLAEAATNVGASHIVTAHTLDDQAETVLFRFLRGSGVTGLSGMTRVAPLPLAMSQPRMMLVRPLLGLPKARLIATLRRARIDFADDPSNRDPRFARARLRELGPSLAREGLSAQRLALLAERARRADRALDAMVEAAVRRLAAPDPRATIGISIDASGFLRLPEEVALRFLGRAIGAVGDEGPVELAKLEALMAALFGEMAGGRRTLAGAVVTYRSGTLTVARAPARRASGRAEFKP